MCTARILIIIFCVSFYSASGQNTGIGTTNPQEKLDVNGNLNVTGTIKANGIAGQPGQVLRLNSSGNIQWADFSQYQNFESLIGSGTWVVPAGVTRILVECWGAGGGGSFYGGGGGGGYILANFNVTPGSNITYNGGWGGDPASAGGMTTVTVNGVTLQALGGQGSVYNTTFNKLNTAYGGGYSASGTSESKFIGIYGSPGNPNSYTHMQSGTSTLEATYGGKGGDAGNALGTGGIGSYGLQNITTFAWIRYADPASGRQGGGGGAGNNIASPGTGGLGQVIIRY